MTTLNEKEWKQFGINAELCQYSPSRLKAEYYKRMTITEIGAKLLKLARERMKTQDQLPIEEPVMVKHSDYRWRDVYESGVHYRRIFSRV